VLDNNGIPITYELFPGNTMDQSTLTCAVEKLKARYRLEKIVVVADRGLNSGDNLAFLVQEGHDFVISYTLKRAPCKLKDLALDDSGWVTDGSELDGQLSRFKILEETLQVKVPAVPLPKRKAEATAPNIYTLKFQ
jgi:transposase